MKLPHYTSRSVNILYFCTRHLRFLVRNSVWLITPLYASALTFPTYPLVGGGGGAPSNVLIIYDNSASMGYSKMDGSDSSGGGDPDNRSNISRRVLTNLLNKYHSQFNWGIEVFDGFGSTDLCYDNNGRCGIYFNYQGTSNTMVFTNDCTGNLGANGVGADTLGGVSKSNNSLRCVANPEPNGYNYLTYEKIGGWYGGTYNKNWAWATLPLKMPSNGAAIDFFDHHNPAVTTWNMSNDNSVTFNAQNDFSDPANRPFEDNPFTWEGCVDSSGSCTEYNLPRMLFLKVGWLFDQQVTGLGKMVEEIKPDSAPGHYNKLLNLLLQETPTIGSIDIKSGTEETPLMGSFITAKNYFSGALPGYKSPIQPALSCQKNYVILATDGLPTADSKGKAYKDSDTANATSGKAYKDLYPEITALRNTKIAGNTYDVQTFVLGMGDAIGDKVALDGLNKMAQTGGTGSAYKAADEAALSASFQSIVDKIGVAIPLRQSNGDIALSVSANISDTQLYKTAYGNPGGNIWEGNVLKSKPSMTMPASGPITYFTGNITGSNTGAAALLTSDQVNGKPRQILTGIRNGNGVTGVPFLWNSLDQVSQTAILNLSETATQGQARVNYIRGNRTGESSATNPSGFRKRDLTVLGDIVDSSPVYVGPSVAGYSDSDFSKATPSFSVYYKNMLKRKPMVYVGANDGMLHGFDANTLAEVFSYIPNSVLYKLKDLSSPNYAHSFYVNATPLVVDTIIPSRGWTTELIGFCGVGGTGLFALDITSPDATRPSTMLASAESKASGIVLWELNSAIDQDIGYIVNQGQVNRARGGLSMQQAKMSNGRMAIITGNGYNAPNNSTGLVVVYLDKEGGVPEYKKIMIPEVKGGLSTPTAVDVDFDGKVDYAYAGDLHGNVWRFDLRGEDTQWNTLIPFKLFKIPSTTTAIESPITTAPAVSMHCSKPGLIVVVGTGKYLEDADNNPSYSDNHADYIVGLWDKLDSSIINKQDLVTQSYETGTNALLLSSDNPVNWNNGKRGWILQLFSAGLGTQPARIVVPPYVSDGLVYFNTMTPSNSGSSCTAGGFLATSQILQACTGQPPITPQFDLNYDGKVNAKDQYLVKSKLLNPTGVILNAIDHILHTDVAIPQEAMDCTPAPCDKVETDGHENSPPTKSPSMTTKRLTWKERI